MEASGGQGEQMTQKHPFVPAGEYQARLDEWETRERASGEGIYIQYKFTIAGGPYQGAEIYHASINVPTTRQSNTRVGHTYRILVREREVALYGRREYRSDVRHVHWERGE